MKSIVTYRNSYFILNFFDHMFISETFSSYGTRGPQEADEMLSKHNFKYSGTYKWTDPTNNNHK